MLPLRYARVWQLAGIVVLITVLLFAAIPTDLGRPAQLLGDKWLHGITFGVLTIWFCGQYAPRSYWILSIGLLAFGLFIELLQHFLPYRSAELKDLAADLLGIGSGLLVAFAGVGGWSLRFEQWLLAR